MLICNKRCFVSADGTKLVEETSPDASVLFATPGKQRMKEDALEKFSNFEEFFVDEKNYAPSAPKPPDVPSPVNTTAIIEPAKSLVTLDKAEDPLLEGVEPVKSTKGKK